MRGEAVCLWQCCCCHWHVHLLLLVRRGCAVDVGAGLVCPCGVFRWCCKVPELATITTVETTVWSANGCTNAVRASSRQQWLVSRSRWLPAGGHAGHCGVVEAHGRSGHGTSSASAGGLSGVKSCVSVLGWERPVPGCRAVREQRLSVK